MSGLWRNTQGTPPGLRTWLVAAGLVWVAAPIAGLILVIPATMLMGMLLTGNDPSPLARAMGWLSFIGFTLIYSPLFSWLGLALATPIAAWLLRTGFGGVGSFALLGLAIGAAGGGAAVALAGGAAFGFWAVFAALFGLVNALALRWLLFVLTPKIFTKR
jgi:hypothetical protein